MFFILLEQVDAQLSEMYEILQLLTRRHTYLAAQIILDLCFGGQFCVIYKRRRF